MRKVIFGQTEFLSRGFSYSKFTIESIGCFHSPNKLTLSLALTNVLPWIVIPLLVAVICYLIYDRRRKADGVEVALDVLPKLETDSVVAVEAAPSELEELREQMSSFNQAMAQCPSSIMISDLNGNIQL